jgi:hypothetical protein
LAHRASLDRAERQRDADLAHMLAVEHVEGAFEDGRLDACALRAFGLA